MCTNYRKINNATKWNGVVDLTNKKIDVIF